MFLFRRKVIHTLKTFSFADMQAVQQLVSPLRHLTARLRTLPPLASPCRSFSASPALLFQASTPLLQKKARKLPAHMYDGGDNGGLQYGSKIMEMNRWVQVRGFPGNFSLQEERRLIRNHYRKGHHIKFRPNKNPLGYGVPFAKAIVIRPVIKKPKKPNSANRKVRGVVVVVR